MSTPDETVAELRSCRPELARDLERILAGDPPPGGDPEPVVTPSRRRPASLQAAGRWIHSSVDPGREAARLVPSDSDTEGQSRSGTDSSSPVDGVVIEGLGLGYVLEALEQTGTAPAPRPWIAVTHHPSLLRIALSERSAAWWCRVGPDRLLPGWLPGTLVPVLQERQIREPILIQTRGECLLAAEASAELGDRFARYRERMRVNRNTLARFGSLWVRNTLAGVERYGLLPGMDELEGVASGSPVVVLAAGPTLDAVLPHLPVLREHALVIAVDTAVVPAQRSGVQPDLAVISDPQYWNTRHLDRIGPTRAILIAEPATHPRTLRLWPGPGRMSASLFPLGEFFDRHAGRHRRLGAGGSVATSAWDLARILGASEILLAGADLGFPGFRTHCSDSFFERRLVSHASRRNPAETGLYRYLHGAQTRMVARAGGGTLPSDARMQIYRSWFTEQSRRYPDLRTLLLSPESSAIEGIDWIGPEQWLSKRHPNAELAAIRSTLRTLGDRNLDPGSPDTARSELMAALERLEDCAMRGVHECAALLEQRDHRDDAESVAGMRVLDGIDREIAALADREIAGFLSGRILGAIAELDDGTVAGALNSAQALYESLVAAVTYHRHLLSRYQQRH